MPKEITPEQLLNLTLPTINQVVADWGKHLEQYPTDMYRSENTLPWKKEHILICLLKDLENPMHEKDFRSFLSNSIMYLQYYIPDLSMIRDHIESKQSAANLALANKDLSMQSLGNQMLGDLQDLKKSFEI